MRRPQLALLALVTAPAAAQVRPFFDAPLVVGDEYKRIVKTLDLNGDGYQDAFGWWTDSAYGAHPGQGFLHGWINDGTGRLGVAWDVAYTNNIYDAPPTDVAATGDLDGDGDDDFVVATTSRVRVYRSNGAQPPTLLMDQVTPIGFSLDCIDLVNFDGDPAPELVLAGGAILAICDIDLSIGAFLERTRVTTSFSSWGKLVVADLTGDGELDVLLSGTRVHPVVGGQLQPWVQNFPLPWLYTSYDTRFDGGDVDGDGDLDLVAFAVPLYSGTPQYRIVRRTGPSTWNVEPPVNGGPARKLVDVDGDGDLDGVCCGGSGGSSERSRNSGLSAFRIALNDGTGAFATSIAVPSVGSWAIGGVEDLDHDGDLDLVGGRCVLYAQAPLREHPSPPIGTGYQQARTVVDLDADGDPDFEPRAGTVQWNLGQGPGPAAAFDLPAAGGGIYRDGDPYPGDWDGDGDVDLLFRLSGSYGLELVRNRGSGCFASIGPVADSTGFTGFPTGAMNSLAEDVDGDGDLDLVLRSRTSVPVAGLASAWWRNTNGWFTWQETFPDRCIARVADVNGDGTADLVATAGAGVASPLAWAPGTGPGTFGAWIAIPDTSARSLLDEFALADLDGDGDLDIAVGHKVVGRAYVHTNDGAGNFTRGPSLGNLVNSPTTAMVAEAGDVDGDGRLDLVFGPVLYAANSVALHLRAADDSGWRPAILQNVYGPTTSSVPPAFTLADPDGDGDVDLVADRLVRNTSHQGADGGQRVQDQSGTAGLGGVKPLLGARGPFRVGEQAQLRLRGLRPGASGHVVVAFLSDPVPPSFGPMQAATHHRIHSQIPLTASGAATDPAGTGSWSLEYTVPGYSAGRTKCYLAVVEDDAAACGEARSNRLYVTYGP